jgi:DNA-binding ferritin-like protein (Dps family)
MQPNIIWKIIKKIENRELKSAQRRFKKHPNETREAFELIFEVEAFLFQVKSSLDMLVKLLNPIIGSGFVRTKTYEKKGESIIKGLEQLKKKKNTRKEEIDQLIELIRSDKDSWIETVVDYRDELNHFKGLNDFKFIPRQIDYNQIIAERPRFKGYEVVSFMETIYRNNIEFSHDFVCVALSIRMPTCIYLETDTEENALQYFGNIPSAKFVKYCWYLNTNKTEPSA